MIRFTLISTPGRKKIVRFSVGAWYVKLREEFISNEDFLPRLLFFSVLGEVRTSFFLITHNTYTIFPCLLMGDVSDTFGPTCT